MRRKVQIIFQNPYGSLNPRQKIGEVLGEPLLLNTNKTAAERRDLAMQMLVKVGLGSGTLQSLSAHVLRRSAPAYRHRALRLC